MLLFALQAVLKVSVYSVQICETVQLLIMLFLRGNVNIIR